MHWLRPLLFALTFVILLARTEGPAQEKPEKPAKSPKGEEDPETLPGKVRLKLDPGRHTNWVRSLLFTPDSKQLLISSTDGTIAVWDTQTWQRLRVLRLPGIWPPRSLAVSRDGRTLVVGFAYLDKQPATYCVVLMNLETGRLEKLLQGHRGSIFGVAYTPGDKRIISSSGDKTIRAWDPEKDEAEQVIQTDRVVHGLAVSPDGTRLAETAESDETITIRDLKSGKVTATFQGGKPVASVRWGGGRGSTLVAWSADGKYLATAAGDGLRLWTPEGKLLRHLLQSDEDPIWANLVFSADSRWLFGTDARKDRVVLFDAASGKEERSFRLTAPRRCQLSPDGKLAVAAGWKDAVVDGVVQGVCEVRVWKTSDGERVRLISGPNWLAGEYLEAGWSGDGKKVSWRKVDNPEEWKGAATFDLEKLELGEPLPKNELRGPVTQRGAYSVKVFDKRSVEVLKGNKRHALLTVPENLPDIDTEIVKHPLTFVGKEEQTDRVMLMPGFRPSLVFDVADGKVAQMLWPGENREFSAAPSPDGRFILALNTDQVLRIFRRDDGGRLLLSLFVQDRQWIAWTPGGYYAVSPQGEKLMGYTVDVAMDQAPSFHPAARFRKQFYRPDLVKKVIETGDVEEALKQLEVSARDVGETLPPHTLVSHKPAGARVMVEATAQAGVKEQPVRELQLLIDGRPARLANGDLAVKTFTPPLEKDARAEWSLSLEPGKHKLSVRATSKDAYSISDDLVVEVAGNTRKGKLFYVGIGVNEFKTEPELNLTGAVLDVKNMEKCLSKECSRCFEVKPTLLLDNKATGKAIVETLTGLQPKLKPTDVVIVHYSSHGEVEGGGLYLLCHDSKRGNLKETAVPGDRLRDILGGYPCPVLLILDACHSGKFPLNKPLRSPTDPLSRLLADDSCGVAVMTAALAHQKALDTKEGGVFTLALIEGLSGQTDPDKFSNRLYVPNLYTYVLGAVTRKSENKQMPLYLPSGSVPPIVLKE